MDFMKMMETNQKQHTENGAVGFVTTGDYLVDLNFKIPSLRESLDTNLFDLAYAEDEKLTLKWLLYLRDIKQGAGERSTFRNYLRHLVLNYPNVAYLFLENVPIEEYGRWDDIISLLDMNDFEVDCIITSKIQAQLDTDYVKAKMNKPISLLAKWMPSENASSKHTKWLANKLRHALKMTSKEYRKRLSFLRRYLDVTEVKTSANQWESINYNAVPSIAHMNYQSAFMKHDFTRYTAYLDDVKNGKAKINAETISLPNLIHKYAYMEEVNDTFEEMWDAQECPVDFSDILVVRDGSGSMLTPIANSSVEALDVADAMTLFCAEHNTGAYKNKFITFSSTPKIVNVTGNTLRDKLDYLRTFDDYDTTDISSVFELILDTAVKNNCKQEELPKSILIISDMEFDEYCSYYSNDTNETLFETLSALFASKGYELPKLIFWNVNSRTNTIPVTKNPLGVILLSGFSKQLFTLALDPALSPYKALVNVLNTDRYKIIDEVFA